MMYFDQNVGVSEREKLQVEVLCPQVQSFSRLYYSFPLVSKHQKGIHVLWKCYIMLDSL